MPDNFNTPDALMQLSDAFSDFARKLNDYIDGSADPHAPEMLQLRTVGTRITMNAAIIAGIAADLAASDVLKAVTDLKTEVGKAQETLHQINEAKLALKIVASVLSAAAAVATGNPLAAAPAVIALINDIAGAINAAKGGAGNAAQP